MSKLHWRKDTTYPFLKIARQRHVSYREVMQFADEIGKLDSVALLSREADGLWQIEVINAEMSERRRRRAEA